MLHPSYTDLINAVNSEVEPGEQPVVQSRYSIVLATSKRARQIIGGDEPLIARAAGKKPLSIAVQELYEGKVKILGDNDAEEAEEAKAIEAAADGDPEAFGIEAEQGAEEKYKYNGIKDRRRPSHMSEMAFSIKTGVMNL